MMTAIAWYVLIGIIIAASTGKLKFESTIVEAMKVVAAWPTTMLDYIIDKYKTIN